MGLKDYPSRWNRVTEVWEKGVTQIKSGFVGKGISKYDGIFDHYKKQSESWENLDDNELVKYLKSIRIQFFRGDLKNVAKRLLDTAIQYKSNLEDDDWHAGTNISNNYGTTWQGNAIKVDSSYSKLRWFKVKATGTNNGTGSNHKGNSIGIIYKRKKPK